MGLKKLKCIAHRSENCGLGCKKPSRAQGRPTSRSDYAWHSPFGVTSAPSGVDVYGDDGSLYGGGSGSYENTSRYESTSSDDTSRYSSGGGSSDDNSRYSSGSESYGGGSSWGGSYDGGGGSSSSSSDSGSSSSSSGGGGGGE